jgi:hypothetical protein
MPPLAIKFMDLEVPGVIGDFLVFPPAAGSLDLQDGARMPVREDGSTMGTLEGLRS